MIDHGHGAWYRIRQNHKYDDEKEPRGQDRLPHYGSLP